MARAKAASPVCAILELLDFCLQIEQIPCSKPTVQSLLSRKYQMITLFSVLLLASETSSTSVQPEPVAPAAVETPKPKAKEERKICKREEESMTRLGSKRCLTASQWRAREREENR